MQREAKAMDQDSMIWATSMSKNRMDHYLRIALLLKDDPKKENRILSGQCLVCYYSGSRIGGAAITHQPCGLCKKEQSYCSTYTDAICMDCAIKNSLCKHCGGDSELRERRRKWPKAED